ncbi:MAG: hypothetical protein NVS4B2_29750 [Chloroflexota bacterium]
MDLLTALYCVRRADDQIRKQVGFTPGRIILAGGKAQCGSRKRVDYFLASMSPPIYDVPVMENGILLGTTCLLESC